MSCGLAASMSSMREARCGEETACYLPGLAGAGGRGLHARVLGVHVRAAARVRVSVRHSHQRGGVSRFCRPYFPVRWEMSKQNGKYLRSNVCAGGFVKVWGLE